MAAADLNSIRATIEGRLATELASSPVIPCCFSQYGVRANAKQLMGAMPWSVLALVNTWAKG
jgi:hypothetical protein